MLSIDSLNQEFRAEIGKDIFVLLFKLLPITMLFFSNKLTVERIGATSRSMSFLRGDMV